jgi:hypothetical protein
MEDLPSEHLPTLSGTFFDSGDPDVLEVINWWG